MTIGGNGTSGLRRSPRVLGSLESQLMDLLWGSSRRLSGQEICDDLAGQHNYKTVMTVLNRLVAKNLLERELDGRAYKYRPRHDRTEFLRAVADELVQDYARAYGAGGLTYLSAALESGTSGPGSALVPSASVRHSLSPADKRHGLVILVGALIVLQLLRILAGRR